MCFRFSTCKTQIVISKLCRIALAQDLNKKYVYALIKNKPLINVYKKIGYEEASTYSIEMIKKL